MVYLIAFLKIVLDGVVPVVSLWVRVRSWLRSAA